MWGLAGLLGIYVVLGSSGHQVDAPEQHPERGPALLPRPQDPPERDRVLPGQPLDAPGRRAPGRSSLPCPCSEASGCAPSILGVSLSLVYAQALTGGRTGYVTWAAVGLVLCIARWRRYLLLVPFVMIGDRHPGAGRQGTNAARVRSGRTGSATDRREVNQYEVTSGRTLIWPYVIEKIKQKPVFGYGREAMASTGLAQQLWDELGESFPHPHNAYLETLFDGGWVGLLLRHPLLPRRALSRLPPLPRLPEPLLRGGGGSRCAPSSSRCSCPPWAARPSIPARARWACGAPSVSPSAPSWSGDARRIGRGGAWGPKPAALDRFALSQPVAAWPGRGSIASRLSAGTGRARSPRVGPPEVRAHPTRLPPRGQPLRLDPPGPAPRIPSGGGHRGRAEGHLPRRPRAIPLLLRHPHPAVRVLGRGQREHGAPRPRLRRHERAGLISGRSLPPRRNASCGPCTGAGARGRARPRPRRSLPAGAAALRSLQERNAALAASVVEVTGRRPSWSTRRRSACASSTCCATRPWKSGWCA